MGDGMRMDGWSWWLRGGLAGTALTLSGGAVWAQETLEGGALWKEVGNSVSALVTAGDASPLTPEATEFQGAAVTVSNSSPLKEV